MGPIEYYFAFIGAISTWPWGMVIFGLKVLAIGISLVALYWYISTIGKMGALFAHAPAEVPISTEQESLIQNTVATPWLEIQQKMKSDNPSDWTLAIIQADAILDKMLKASGYVGDTMGDRLKQINPAELEAIDDVWRSHKIRNRVAHGTETITEREALIAIRGYERAFRELNYI
jgi:hypothetical protein